MIVQSETEKEYLVCSQALRSNNLAFPLNQVRADQQQETQEKQCLRSWTGWNFHGKCDTILPREERTSWRAIRI